MNLRHISLPCGPEQLRPRSAMDDKVLPLMKPWLGAALSSGKRLPLALPAIAHVSASAKIDKAALHVDIWRPLGNFRRGRPHWGETTLMAAFCVAPDPVAGDKLWASLLDDAGLAWRTPPQAPWCGTLPPPGGAAASTKDAPWLPALASSIAFAWLSP